MEARIKDVFGKNLKISFNVTPETSELIKKSLLELSSDMDIGIEELCHKALLNGLSRMLFIQAQINENKKD